MNKGDSSNPSRLLFISFFSRMSISDVFKGQSGLSVNGRVEAGFVMKDDRVLCLPLNQVDNFCCQQYVQYNNQFVIVDLFNLYLKGYFTCTILNMKKGTHSWQYTMMPMARRFYPVCLLFR